MANTAQGTSVPSNTQNIAVTTLANLDGYLAACKYGKDHPWRIEIAAALAATAAQPARAPVEPDDRDHAAEHVEETVGMVGSLLGLALEACAAKDMVRAEVTVRAALRYSADILDSVDVLVGGAA
jgi:hypothetical protein